jgi:hypothetical protein
MNKSKILQITAVGLLIGWVGCGAAAAADLPAAVVPSPVYRFEPVIEGAEIVHEFVIRNTGGAPLEIQAVETG